MYIVQLEVCGRKSVLKPENCTRKQFTYIRRNDVFFPESVQGEIYMDNPHILPNNLARQ